MSSLEESFQKGCEAREIPGVVLLAADKSGMPSLTLSPNKDELVANPHIRYLSI